MNPITNGNHETQAPKLLVGSMLILWAMKGEEVAWLKRDWRKITQCVGYCIGIVLPKEEDSQEAFLWECFEAIKEPHNLGAKRMRQLIDDAMEDA